MPIIRILLENPWLFVIVYYVIKLAVQVLAIRFIGLREEMFDFVPKFGTDFAFMAITIYAADFINTGDVLTIEYVLSTLAFLLVIIVVFGIAYWLYLFQKMVGSESERAKTWIGRRWEGPNQLLIARACVSILAYALGSFAFIATVNNVLK